LEWKEKICNEGSLFFWGPKKDVKKNKKRGPPGGQCVNGAITLGKRAAKGGDRKGGKQGLRFVTASKGRAVGLWGGVGGTGRAQAIIHVVGNQKGRNGGGGGGGEGIGGKKEY